MKDSFFEQIELLVATYQRAGADERRTFDEVVDHLTAILYELLHPEEMEGEQDMLVLTEPSPSRRVLH